MADNLRATEQNAALAQLARLLQGTHEFASKPFGYNNPPARALSEMLGLPATARTVERMSYGEPLTTGRGMTTRMRPDTEEALLAVAPLAGSAARVAPRVARELAPAAGAMAMRAAEVGGMPVGGLGVIKNKGGNWLAGSVEGVTNSMKSKVSGSDPATRIADIQAARAQNLEAGVPVDEERIAALMAELEPRAAINKWLETKLGSYIKNEMATPQDPVRLMLEEWPAKRDALLATKQAKIDRLLAKRETADPRAYPMIDRDIEDVRAEMDTLAKKSVIHIPTGDLEQGTSWMPESLATSRMRAGFPVHGVAESPAAKGWEASADAFINAAPASEHTRPLTASEIRRGLGSTVDENPWLLKVPPETPVYYPEFGKVGDSDMGFLHVVDELRNALNPASGLPENLLWKYGDLEKVTVPQALQRVGEINDWRAAQKFAADQARANNAATVLHKDFPDSSYKWVELAPSKEPKTYTAESLPHGFELTKDRDGYYQVLNRNEGEVPTTDSFSRDPEQAITKFNEWVKNKGRDFDLERALKYEGETMGHCVGGYCPDVLEGRSRIFSLRNKKTGEPHVTVEVQPKSGTLLGQYMASLPEEEAANALKNPPLDIVQIKGKANKAPKEEYLPFVQDFVRSGQWGRVGDLQNTGLQRVEEGSIPGFAQWMNLRAHGSVPNIPAGYYTPDELVQFGAESGLREAHPSVYMTWRKNLGLTGKEEFAEGGLVDGAREYSPLEVDAIYNNVIRGYAEGGSVESAHLPYDEAKISSLVNALHEELNA